MSGTVGRSFTSSGLSVHVRVRRSFERRVVVDRDRIVCIQRGQEKRMDGRVGVEDKEDPTKNN